MSAINFKSLPSGDSLQDLEQEFMGNLKHDFKPISRKFSLKSACAYNWWYPIKAHAPL
jgi:hypothetical protein